MSQGYKVGIDKTYTALYAKYLQSIVYTSNRVKCFNLAQGGTGSMMSSLCIDEMLKHVTFEEADIVFIEFTLNDFAYECNCWKNAQSVYDSGEINPGRPSVDIDTRSFQSIERLIRK